MVQLYDAESQLVGDVWSDKNDDVHCGISMKADLFEKSGQTKRLKRLCSARFMYSRQVAVEQHYGQCG